MVKSIKSIVVLHPKLPMKDRRLELAKICEQCNQDFYIETMDKLGCCNECYKIFGLKKERKKK